MKSQTILASPRIIYLLLFFNSILMHVHSQSDFEVLNSNYSKESIFTFDNRYSGVKGSPYLFDDWLPAKVQVRHMTQDQHYTVDNISAKFNIYDQTLYVKPERSSSVVAMDRGILSVTMFIESDSITILPVAIKGKTVYCAQLSSKPVEVIKVYSRSFREANYKGGYSTGTTYDEFINKDQWMIKQQGEWKVAKNSKKFWVKLFPKDKELISDFFNNASIADDNRLKQLLNQLSY